LILIITITEGQQRYPGPNTILLSDYDLIPIQKTRNEVYRAVHKTIPGNTYILKYTNESSQEVEILNYLKDKISNIPIVVQHN